MILGLALPTYSGVLPADRPLGWLLDRCRDHGFRALEASLPEPDGEDPEQIGKRCEDEGVTWIGYWSDDFVTPDGGMDGLLVRARESFEAAVRARIEKLVIFGRGDVHNRFSKKPPLEDQLSKAADHLAPVAESAAEHGLVLGYLPHLDYRAREALQIVESVASKSLRLAYDTTNAFPVCEDPVDAAKVALPHAIAVALKDVQIFPHRSNDVTIWGTPIGEGSVDFATIFELLPTTLPDPDQTTVCVKLRLPPESQDHEAWMGRSLDFIRGNGLFPSA